MSFRATSDSFSQWSDALGADLSYNLDSSTFDFEPSDALRKTRMTFSPRGVGHLLEDVYATSDPPDTIPRLKSSINTTLLEFTDMFVQNDRSDGRTWCPGRASSNPYRIPCVTVWVLNITFYRVRGPGCATWHLSRCIGRLAAMCLRMQMTSRGEKHSFWESKHGMDSTSQLHFQLRLQ